MKFSAQQEVVLEEDPDFHPTEWIRANPGTSAVFCIALAAYIAAWVYASAEEASGVLLLFFLFLVPKMLKIGAAKDQSLADTAIADTRGLSHDGFGYVSALGGGMNQFWNRAFVPRIDE